MPDLTALDVIEGDTIPFAGLPFVVDSTKPFGKTRVRMVLRHESLVIRLNMDRSVPISLREP